MSAVINHVIENVYDPMNAYFAKYIHKLTTNTNIKLIKSYCTSKMFTCGGDTRIFDCITAIYLPVNVHITDIYANNMPIYCKQNYIDNVPIETILKQCNSLPNLDTSPPIFNEEEMYIDGVQYIRHVLIKPCIPIALFYCTHIHLYFNKPNVHFYVENIHLSDDNLSYLTDYISKNYIMLKSTHKMVLNILNDNDDDFESIYIYNYFKCGCEYVGITSIFA